MCLAPSQTTVAERPARFAAPPLRVAALIVAAMGAILPGRTTSAQGPCDPQWLPGSGQPGTDGPIYALTTWDPDAAGPGLPLLVLGGGFGSAGGPPAIRIATWDGVEFQTLGPGLGDTVRALTAWDADGEGPGSPLLVAAGDFLTDGATLVTRIAAWDGSSWQPFGAGMNATIWALESWDPDGDGPGAPQLIAGGDFTTAGGSPIAYLARWDGAAWQPLGAGLNDRVRALTTWDPDGEGPALPQLVVGGLFTSAGGALCNAVARWDGAAWRAFGAGVNSRVYAFASWDPDGDGPQAPSLVAGGEFTRAGGADAAHIARWDGSSWQALGSGLDKAVHAVLAWDPDGDGPGAPQLVAGGTFTTAVSEVNHVARWDGQSWLAFGAGVNATVWGAALWDPDGDGPGPPEPVVGGEFTTADDLPVNRIARYDGSSWRALGSGMSGPVHTFTLWDADRAGPGPPQVVAGGSFNAAGGVPTNFIARWDGAAWNRVGSGLNGAVWALLDRDPMGEGGFVAGGAFTVAGGSFASRIARFNGEDWEPLGNGSDGTVRALAEWDPDGSGPGPAVLVAGGYYSRPGGGSSYVGTWDGSAWQGLGSGLNNPILAVTAWDADGDGPDPPQLIIGGQFFSTAAGPNRIARWDGAAWRSLGTGGANSTVRALTTWDPDDGGPAPPLLVAGGDFTVIGGVSAERIARWDGSAWQPLPPGMEAPVHALTTWDPDAAGPAAARLVAGGEFIGVGGRIATWEGVAWQALSDGLGNTVRAVTAGDTGAGPGVPGLFAGGDFLSAGGNASAHIARYSPAGGSPALTSQPVDATTCRAGAASFSAAASGVGPLSYRWQCMSAAGQPCGDLADGRYSDPDTGLTYFVTGAASPTLTLLQITPGNHPNVLGFSLRVSNVCGTVTSDTARLTVCLADFNCDGFVDGIDYDQFNNAFESGEPGADINGDGFLDGIDYDQFINAFEAAC